MINETYHNDERNRANETPNEMIINPQPTAGKRRKSNKNQH